jgi:hypothetical protein
MNKVTNAIHKNLKPQCFYITLFVLATVGYIQGVYFIRGTRWRSWLRHCGTSRKVVGSIPDGGLRSNQPVTEMSTRNVSWEVKTGGAWG